MTVITRFQGRAATPNTPTRYREGQADPSKGPQAYQKKDPELEAAPFKIQGQMAAQEGELAKQQNESIQKTVGYLQELQAPDELYLAKSKADMQLFAYDSYSALERQAMPGGDLRGSVAAKFDEFIKQQVDSAPNDSTRTQILMMAPQLRAKLEIQADESQRNLNDTASVKQFSATSSQYEKLARRYPQFADQLKGQLESYSKSLAKGSKQKEAISDITELANSSIDSAARSSMLMEGSLSKEEFDQMGADEKAMTLRKAKAYNSAVSEMQKQEADAIYKHIVSGGKLSSYDESILKRKAKAGDQQSQRALISYHASRRMDAMNLKELEDLEKQLLESNKEPTNG